MSPSPPQTIETDWIGSYVLAYDIAIAESGQSIGGLLIVLQLQCCQYLLYPSIDAGTDED